MATSVVPKLHGKNTRIWLIGGVVAGGGYLYYQHKQAAALAVATPTDPNSDGTDTGYTDPNTDSSYSDYNQGYAPPIGSPYSWDTGTSVTDNTTNMLPTTNQQWTQMCVDWLEQAGWSRQASAAALAKYLSRKSLSSSEDVIVMTAIGVYGFPPASPGNPVVAPVTPTPPKPPGKPTHSGPYIAGTYYDILPHHAIFVVPTGQKVRYHVTKKTWDAMKPHPVVKWATNKSAIMKYRLVGDI